MKEAMVPVRIEGGKLLLENRADLAKAIKQLPDGDAVLIVKHAAISTIRSDKANKYYWSCVLSEMAKENSGGDQTPEQIHDAMCEMFLPNEQKRVEFFNRMTGETLAVETDHRRSSKLKGEPFYVFVEQVRKFALEFLGVRTEDPDPDYWRKKKAQQPEPDETTHFVPFDSVNVGWGRARALCGNLAAASRHSTAPTCKDCQQAQAHVEAMEF